MDKAIFQLVIFENGEQIKSWEFEHSIGTFNSGDRLKIPGRNQPVMIKEVVHDLEEQKADSTMNRFTLIHRIALLV